MKKILLFFFVGAIYSLFSFVLWFLTDGFSLKKIESNLTFSPKWEVISPSQEEIVSLLSQNFYYIGMGSQCYVFESEDKQFVLKFFRHSRFHLPKITQLITTPSFLGRLQQQKRETKQYKRDALFQSCKIAYEDLHEETGLLYLHLNKTHHLKKTVILYDKLKRAYPIQIDQYEFILQKHGEQLFPYITHLLDRGKKQEAQEALTDLVSLLSIRLSKGIIDHDPVIYKNAGFCANKALFLDVGAFSKEKHTDTTQELLQTTAQLRNWLQVKDPELANHLDNLIRYKSPQSAYRYLAP